MKSYIIWFGKAFVALIVSFCILTGFCYFYYNLPVHHNSETGSTDRVWDKSTLTMRGNEGFAAVTIDEKGFVNSYPKTKDTIDVLVMGSSHTEGFNVNSDENYTYVLNENFDDAGMELYAYNIGMSGHAMVRCFRNLEDACNEFKPEGYVTIETSNLDCTLSELISLSKGEYEVLTSVESGLVSLLQKNDYLRLLYSQLENAMADDSVSVKKQDEDMDEYRIYLDEMLKNASLTCSEAGVELIVVYKPDLVLNKDGSIAPEELEEKDELFLELAESYGITVLDMYEPFTEHYEKTYCLPNGFSNTQVGVGHLNKNGHKVIADELYAYISEVKA